MPDKNIFIGSGPSDPELPHSSYDLSFNNDLTARFGRIYPCYLQEAVPGSSFVIKPTMAFDLMPMVFPIQTDIRCHLSFFKVPFRILMKSYKDFVSQVGNHVMPYIKRGEGWCQTGSLADYMGLPTTRAEYKSRWFEIQKMRFGFFAEGLSSTSVGDDCYLERFTQDTRCTYNTPASLGFFVPRGVKFDLSNPLSKFIITHETSFNANSLNNYQMAIRIIGTNNKTVRVPSGHLLNLQPRTIGKLLYTKTFSATNGGVAATSSLATDKFALYTGTGGLNQQYGPYRQSQCYLKFSNDVINALNNAIDEFDDVYIVFNWIVSSSPNFGSNVMPISNGPERHVSQDVFSIQDMDVNDNKITVSGAVQPLRIGITQFSMMGLESVVKDGDFTNPFCSYSNNDPSIPVSALPFRAYEFICNYVFRNERVTPFYKNGSPSYNEFLTNDGDGADSTTPVDFFNAPYEYDMFTTCVKTPQFGNAPLVGVSYNDESAQGTLHMVPSGGGAAYDIGVDLDGNANIIGISNYADVADKPSVHRLQEAIEFGISINDFRNVAAFQRFCERFMKAGYQYKEIIKEFYGTNAPIGEEFPEYLGGFSRNIMVNKVLNQSMSDGAALGDFAGSARVAGQGETIKCFCSEQSYIIGLMWFTPTPTYSQVLPKHWIKSQPLDFFNPQFNNIGPQPVLSCEIAPLQMASPDKTKVFGYNRPFVDLVQRFDECHGAFRDSMYNYLLQRFFDSEPELGADFLYVDSQDLTNIFSVSLDTDKIFGRIHFDVKCKQPIPRFAIPRIVG